MKKLLGKFMKDERGDVIQYILVLGVIVVIMIFAFPKIKTAMQKNTNDTMTHINEAFKPIPSTTP